MPGAIIACSRIARRTAATSITALSLALSHATRSRRAATRASLVRWTLSLGRATAYGDDLRASLEPSISRLAADTWDRLLPASASPFLEHRWLALLEETSCVGSGTSWQPAYLVVRDGDHVVGAAPLYLERYGDGDFLGDDEWELAALSRALPYSPKLVVGIPFMPVPGPRFLVAPDRDPTTVRAALADGVMQAIDTLDARSAHLQLGLRQDVVALAARGFVERLGCQYHWHRGSQRTFADYLNTMDPKRRRAVRRELDALERDHIHIETLRGDAVTPERAREAWSLNRDLFHRYGSEPWLTGDLFAEAARRMPDRLELVHAYTPGERDPVGVAINATRGARMYGRYWGWRRPIRFLHFAVCYYHPIRDCLARSLEAFEPGAGGEHKRVRGLRPTATWSAHWIADTRLASAVVRYVAIERELVAQHLGDGGRPPDESAAHGADPDGGG